MSSPHPAKGKEKELIPEKKNEEIETEEKGEIVSITWGVGRNRSNMAQRKYMCVCERERERERERESFHHLRCRYKKEQCGPKKVYKEQVKLIQQA